MTATRWTEADEAYIIRTYATRTAAQQVKGLRGRFSIHSVNHKRSALLKAGRISETRRRYNRRWTEAERHAILDGLADGTPLLLIARGIKRTYDAVRSWTERNGITVASHLQARTVKDVAALFGVSADTIADVWIARGWLPASRRNLGKRRPFYAINDEHLLAFIENRLTWPFWRVEWITDPDWRQAAQDIRDAAGGHWSTPTEIAARYHYSASMVWAWIRAGALPATRITNACFVWSTDLDGFTPPANTGLWARRRQNVQAQP